MGKKFLTKDQFAVHTQRAEKLAKFMTAHIAANKSKKVAVLLSSGVDSHACLFAALRAKKQVTCYSFTLEDRISTDYRIAEQTAATFGLPFRGIQLSTDLPSMKSYLWEVFNEYNPTRIHINKSSVECLWPLYNALTRITADGNGATVIGLGGDTFFCMLRSQKKRLHEYELVKQEYYDNVVKNASDVQTIMMNNWLAKHAPRHELIIPFHTKEAFQIFKCMGPFDPGCKPIQKAPVRLAFWEEFQQTDVRVHQSFQKGDSGISDHFEEILIPSDWNTRGLKSVKGIYNDLETGVIRKPGRTIFRGAH
jgi:asparagine synthetase B (glutamine-hydrolysing)